MRFLLSVAALSALSIVSGACVVKDGASLGGSSTAATACTTVISNGASAVNILGNSPVAIPIPGFDNVVAFPGAILDAVYVNWIDADYQVSGTYSVSGAPLSNFVAYATVPVPWGLYSTADNSAIVDFTNVVNPLNTGGLSLATGSTSTVASTLCEPITQTDAGAHSTTCRRNTLQAFAFTVADNTFASTQLSPGDGVQTFTPNYSVQSPLTYIAFDGPAVNTATSGTILTQSPSAAYLSAWTLTTTNGVSQTTPAAITGSFTQTAGVGSGTLGLTFAHQLNLAVEIQYDYHLPAVAGDPQFAGFQGQSFQVHGAPESYFALISAPNYYVNARFDYLSTGKCDYNETACFTHPGTYMGLIYVGMRDANILVQAGPHSTGFAGVLINDKPMQIGDRFSMPQLSPNSHVHMVSNSKLNLVLDTITLSIHNSDLFVNFDLALTDRQLLTAGAVPHTVARDATPSAIAHSLNKWYGASNPLHGLIGQTWRNVRYADNKQYQGDITEYQLDKIVDHTFLYCVYEN